MTFLFSKIQSQHTLRDWSIAVPGQVSGENRRVDMVVETEAASGAEGNNFLLSSLARYVAREG